MSNPSGPPPGQPGQPGQSGRPPYGSPPPPPSWGPPPSGPPGYGQQPQQHGQPGYGQPHPGQHGFGGPQGAPPASSAARLVGWVMVGCAAVVAIAAFLPWASIGEYTVNGIGGDDVEGGPKDGAITLVLALVAIAAGVVRGLGVGPSGLRLGTAITGLVAGALVSLIAVIDVIDILGNDDLDAFGLDISVGIGLWLTLVLGLAVAGAGVAALVRRR